MIENYLKALRQWSATVQVGTVARLRLAFLVPFVGASITLLGIWVAVLYTHEHAMITNKVAHERALIERTYRDDIEHDTRMLQAAMTVIQRDGVLHMALARRDRDALLQLAAPLNADLRRRFGITHFYFTGPDRLNILRLHQPERYGDIIDRYTTLDAERTGTMSYGVELGPLGTLTLRLVVPWYAIDADHRLIGYVELGMEIDHILKTVQAFGGVPVFILVSKQFLQRTDWEAGMRMLGRTPDWDRFPDTVQNNQAGETIPPALAGRLAGGLPAHDTLIATTQTLAEHRAAFLPLVDAGARDVGWMVVLIDVSEQLSSSRQTIHTGAMAGVLVIGLLIAFFHGLTGRIGQRIARYEDKLQQLAMRDGLTGLYNRRMFHTLLEQEFAHAQRYNRPVSLLMLDIDHFKRVNDSRGHQAGDAILRGVGELLVRQARAIDHVCRYGGEEITIILPEADIDAAALVAERLRAAVEALKFNIIGGEAIHITASFGVASWPAQVDDAEALIAAADAAMYTAKQRGRNQIRRYEPGDTLSIEGAPLVVATAEKEA